MSQSCFLRNLNLIPGPCSTNRSSDTFGPLACSEHLRHAQLIAMRSSALGYENFEIDRNCIALCSINNGHGKIKRCENSKHTDSLLCGMHLNMTNEKRDQYLKLCYFIVYEITPMDVDNPDEIMNNYTDWSYDSNNSYGLNNPYGSNNSYGSQNQTMNNQMPIFEQTTPSFNFGMPFRMPDFSKYGIN